MITVRWLLATARNLVGNEYQRRARMQQLLEQVAVEELTRVSYRTDEKAEDLRLAMSGLPPLDVLALRLTYWDGFSAAEVARVLDCSTAAVWMRLTRARATLRGLLEPRNESARQPRAEEVAPLERTDAVMARRRGGFHIRCEEPGGSRQTVLVSPSLDSGGSGDPSASPHQTGTWS